MAYRRVKTQEAKGLNFYSDKPMIYSGYTNVRVNRQNIDDKDIVWILDEAQMMATFGSALLSISMVDMDMDQGSVLFNSYGSPSTVVEKLSFGLGSHPIHLPEQRVYRFDLYGF